MLSYELKPKQKSFLLSFSSAFQCDHNSHFQMMLGYYP